MIRLSRPLCIFTGDDFHVALSWPRGLAWQGWGNNEIFYPKPGELEEVARSVETAKRKKQKLNAFEATAICANDLLSSPLYVVGLVTLMAGKLAPVALLMVSLPTIRQ